MTAFILFVVLPATVLYNHFFVDKPVGEGPYDDLQEM